MIKLEALSKSFGGVQAVRGLELEVERGEFLCLLGPSGCGKSTTLRMVAGFLKPDSGRILIGGTDVSGSGPDARPTAMVFQDYAIFPHLSVSENIEFGLKAQRLARGERVGRVAEALDLVGLDGLGARRPSELSGGQQQRVAVARALAISPSVLLMDEPLSNLDAKTRIQLRTQLRAIQRETETTVVYVTHDQEEALALGDRIAVMKEGAIDQLGTGRTVYQEPETSYVADFVGVTNWFSASVDSPAGQATDDLTRIHLLSGEAHFQAIAAIGNIPEGTVRVSLRPEDIQLRSGRTAEHSGNGLDGVVLDEQFLGPMVRTFVEVGDGLIFVHSTHGGWSRGEKVRLEFRWQDARAYPARSGSEKSSDGTRSESRVAAVVE